MFWVDGGKIKLHFPNQDNPSSQWANFHFSFILKATLTWHDSLWQNVLVQICLVRIIHTCSLHPQAPAEVECLNQGQPATERRADIRCKPPLTVLLYWQSRKENKQPPGRFDIPRTTPLPLPHKYTRFTVARLPSMTANEIVKPALPPAFCLLQVYQSCERCQSSPGMLVMSVCM